VFSCVRLPVQQREMTLVKRTANSKLSWTNSDTTS